MPLPVIFAYTGVAFVTGAVVGALSDLTCQCIEITARHRRSRRFQKSRGFDDTIPTTETVPVGFVVTELGLESIDIDVPRTVRFVILIAVSNVAFQLYLNALQAAIPSTGIVAVLEKVAITQLVLNPVFFAVFLSSNTIMRDGGCKNVPRDVRSELWQVWVVAAPVYGVFDIFRFGVISAAWQVAVGNCVDIVFNVFLAYRTNSAAFASVEGEPLTPRTRMMSTAPPADIEMAERAEKAV